MKDCLIIFYKVPELSPVKTRLASVIGQSIAEKVYLHLVDYTQNQVQRLDCKLHVYYFPEVVPIDSWSAYNVNKMQQSNGDLGNKMHTSFCDCFTLGFDKVIIIGTDCPEIKASHINEAFAALNHTDAVIGPAADGGYYLIGLKSPQLNLFTDIEWSSATVTQKTIEKLNDLSLSYTLLETLHDVDVVEDLKFMLKFLD